MMKFKPKTVYLPHINYTVKFRLFKKPPETISNAIVWIKRDDANSCTIFSPAKTLPSSLAHEIMHAIQYICIDRHMRIENEIEHTAYLMQYLLGQALGYEWVK